MDEVKEDEVVKAIKEEYEKKIAEMQEAHKQEIERVKEEEQQRAISQIKAFMSGRTDPLPPVVKVEKEETEEDYIKRVANEVHKNFI